MSNLHKNLSAVKIADSKKRKIKDSTFSRSFLKSVNEWLKTIPSEILEDDTFETEIEGHLIRLSVEVEKVPTEQNYGSFNCFFSIDGDEIERSFDSETIYCPDCESYIFKDKLVLDGHSVEGFPEDYIADSKKIRDYAAEEWEQPTAEWEELLEAVDHDVLLREIFAAWSADEANDMIAHLKRVFDLNSNEQWEVFDAEGNKLASFASEEEANDFADNFNGDTQITKVEDSKHKVEDKAWTEADHAAAFAINADDVVNLYLDGIMELNIPSGIDSKEFAEACINMCKELWSDEEVNFDYGDADFDYIIDGNNLIITLI